MPFCNKCGEELDSDEEFCPNCGAKSKNYKGTDKKTTNKPNIIDTLMSKPKLILLLIVAIIVVGGVISLASNNSSSSGNYVGGHEVSIYGIPFNIPNGFEETKHEGPTNYGETAYFSNKNTQEGFSIHVSTDKNLDLSGKYIKSKSNYNVSGTVGVLVSHTNGDVIFYYYEGNYLVSIKPDTVHYPDLLKAIIK